MISKSEGKKTSEIRLTDEQVAQLEKLTGTRMDTLVVETEPFDNPPLGTPVLGHIFTDPRSKVVARINARFR